MRPVGSGTVLQSGAATTWCPRPDRAAVHRCARSSSAASTRENFWRSAGTAGFQAGPTRTAPASPTARRRRRRRYSRAPRIIQGRLWRPGRPAPTLRRIPTATSPSGTMVCRGRGNPLPCAGGDQGQGPFGWPPGRIPAPIDVQIVAAGPERFAADAGDPGCRTCPGRPAADVCRAHPVPLPPDAPPRARRDSSLPAATGTAVVDLRAGSAAGSARSRRARVRSCRPRSSTPGGSGVAA